MRVQLRQIGDPADVGGLVQHDDPGRVDPATSALGLGDRGTHDGVAEGRYQGCGGTRAVLTQVVGSQQVRAVGAGDEPLNVELLSRGDLAAWGVTHRMIASSLRRCTAVRAVSKMPSRVSEAHCWRPRSEAAAEASPAAVRDADRFGVAGVS
jgi:hypothetical protein